MVIELPGRFWLVSAPSEVSDGQFVVDDTGRAEVRVTPEFYPAFETEILNVAADGSTVSHLILTPDRGPQTVHGLVELENEDPLPVSVVAAHASWTGETQVFRRPLWALTGAHVDRSDRFHGIRARLTAFGAGDAGPARMDHGGTVQLIDGWVTLGDLPAQTWNELGRTVVRPLCTLLTLASGAKVRPLAVEVSRDGGVWWHVHSGSRHVASSSAAPFAEHLIHGSDLSVDILATWLDRAHLLGPLPGAYASVLEGDLSVEAQALILTTVTEGLHRVLFPDTLRFSVKHGERVRQAAVDAVREIDENDATAAAVSGFLSHVHEVGYAKRLDELATRAENLVPGITGKKNKWKSLVYDTRNRYAHQTSAAWMEEDDLDQVLTTAQSLRWVLRLLLLEQAGLPGDLLKDRFADHQRYRFFLSNAAEWQPSVYRANSGG